MFLRDTIRAVIVIMLMLSIASCGSPGSSVAEFQTVQVNISKFSTGTLDSTGSDVYPGNVCSGTTQTTPTTGQTPEIFNVTLQSTPYNNVSNPLNVYVDGYTVTYMPTNGGPAISAFPVTSLGLVVPSGGPADLKDMPLIDTTRKNSIQGSIAPCSGTEFTYNAIVTIHMVEAQGTARVTQDLVFSTNLVLRDIP